MKIIICGAGQVGFQLSRRLSAEGHEVTVIDQSEALIRKISDTLDVGGVVGHAAHPSTLERAGARDAEMIIAVTHLDEVNMIACQVGHSIFNIPTKIARVRAQDYLQPAWADLFRRDHLPIDVLISPEVDVAEAVMRRLRVPGSYDSASFLDGRVRLLATRLDDACPILNTPLRQLSELFPDLHSVIVGIERGGRILVASPDDELFPGDGVYFVVDQEQATRALRLFGHEEQHAKRVIVVGAGNIGLGVARQLEAHGIRARLIERSIARAEYVAERLERTIVYHGDALDRNILEEAAVADAEALIALTDDDRVNVLVCALAKRAGAKSVMALVNEPNFQSLSEQLGVDAFIDPRATTVSTILRHVRKGRVRAVHSIMDGEAEVIEMQLLPTTPIAGKKLREISFPAGAMIGAVLTDGKLSAPNRDTVLEEGDLVVVFSLRESRAMVESLFRVGIDFF